MFFQFLGSWLPSRVKSHWASQFCYKRPRGKWSFLTEDRKHLRNQFPVLLCVKTKEWIGFSPKALYFIANSEPSQVLASPKLGPREKTTISLAIFSSLGFPVSKESACNAGDLDSIPGWERSPGEGNGCPLQYPSLEKSMNCIVHGVAKSRTRLSDLHFTLTGIEKHGVRTAMYPWILSSSLIYWCLRTQGSKKTF